MSASPGTDPGTPSAEYILMEQVRRLPRMLDSTRPDGGINLMLNNPGGRLFAAGQTDKKVKPLSGEYGDGTPRSEIIDIGSPSFTGRRPLLIQHEAEGEQDYRFRAAIAAPRNAYWHSIESLAGRPFRQPIKIIENAPEQLADGGEWVTNADLQGNSLRTLAARMARRSAGYGLSYWWVDYSREKDRPYIRTVLPESVSRVYFETTERRRIHVRMSKAAYDNPEDASDAAKFPCKGHLILVFRDGDPAEGGDDRWAWYEVYKAKDKEGTKFDTLPSPVEIDGQMLDRVSLEPHRKIPFVPIPTGEMTESHFILPPMLEAAQLDYLLLQVTSNLEYATIVANTFIRFAKGLKKEDIDEWRTLGPQFFYATTNENADMKWVTLGAEALAAGMDLSQFLMRAIEVAGLAPMLTRSPGNERATGIAIASSRVMSVAESFYLQWQSGIGEALTLMGAHTSGNTGDPPQITATLSHDIGLDSQAIEHGNLLTKIYLDPTQEFSALAFYTELRRIGLLSEDVDIDHLVAASQSPQMALDREKLEVEKAHMLTGMVQQGHFATQQSAEVLYNALQSLGVLPGDADPVELAAQFELARQRRRNEQLFLGERMATENYWAAEEADEPVEVDLELEKDLGDPEDEDLGDDEDLFGGNPPPGQPPPPAPLLDQPPEDLPAEPPGPMGEE